MIDPMRSAGTVPGAVSKPKDSAAPGFADRLRQGLPAGAVPADPRLAEIQRYTARALGTEAWEVRLLQSYDALSADEALYEVQTSKGPFQVIRSRMGEMSIYPAR